MMPLQDQRETLISSPLMRAVAAAVITMLVVVTAVTGSRATLPVIETWYAGLTKPGFNPPNWIFGPVWSLLYALMIYSAWRVVTRLTSPKDVIVSALIFVIQLVFNASWSLVFFGRQDPSNALYLVVGLEASIIVMILNFARTDRMAAALQLPYAAWVAFASLLNLAIVLLNPPA